MRLDSEKKEIIIFCLITYGGGFLIGIPFNYNHQYLPSFQIIMMFLPTIGVIVAKIGKVRKRNYREFCNLYLGGMFIGCLCVGAYLLGILNEKTAIIIVELLVVAISIASIIIMRKELKIIESIKRIKIVFWGFIFIEIVISLIGTTGDVSTYVEVLISVFPMLFITWGTSISTYIGEELGWRGFLLEKMQKKFGLRTGVVLLGIIWEIWHMPLWFTQYDFSYLEIFVRVPLTISFSVFLGYVYMKTKDVWMCATFHCLVNTFSGRFEEQLVYKTVAFGMSASEIVQIVFMLSLVLFIFSKEYGKREN